MRWYSPPDWIVSEANSDDSCFSDGVESLSTKGQLSQRMQKEGIVTVRLRNIKLWIYFGMRITRASLFPVINQIYQKLKLLSESINALYI